MQDIDIYTFCPIYNQTTKVPGISYYANGKRITLANICDQSPNDPKCGECIQRLNAYLLNNPNYNGEEI